MASRKAWGEFFARVTAKYPGGALDTLLTDWRRATAEADSLRPPPLEPRPTNRDSPARIARMLAERMRRKP